jgi:hypothetical protein
MEIPLKRGSLCISIDLELMWGVWDIQTPEAHEQARTKERAIVRELLSLLEAYDASTTWATVARLMDDTRPPPPEGTKDSWFAPDVVRAVQGARVRQEIGSHTHSHIYFDKNDASTVRADLHEAKVVHERFGVPFDSLVFPRNKVAHLEEVADAGLRVFRSNDAGVIDLFRRNAPRAWPLVNLVQKTVPTAPPVVLPRLWRQNKRQLVELPSSMLFMARGGLRKVVLPQSMRAKLKLGVQHAAAQKKIFHLWFHPSNFYTDAETQFSLLEDLLRESKRPRDSGTLDIKTMSEFAMPLPKAGSSRVASGYALERPAQSDQTAIATFAAKTSVPPQPDHFKDRWWWNAAPVEAMIARHQASGAVAALCAGRRSRMAVDDKVYEATAICDWFVSPDHMGHGLGGTLANALTDEVQAATTMSISNDAVAAFVRLGWTPSPAATIPYYVAPVPVMLAQRFRGAAAQVPGQEIASSEISASTCGAIGPEFDALWQASRRTRRVAAVRDSAALQAHLRLVPTRRYRLTTARRDGALVGYVLSRDLPRNAFPRLGPTRITFLGDVLTASDHDDVFSDLVLHTLRAAALAGQDTGLTMTTYEPYGRALARLGLLSSEHPVLGVRIPRLKTRWMVLPPKGVEIAEADVFLTGLDSDGDLSFGE